MNWTDTTLLVSDGTGALFSDSVMASDGMNGSTAATVIPASQASKRFLKGTEPEFATLKLVRRRLWE